jgi:hypothetical protein
MVYVHQNGQLLINYCHLFIYADSQLFSEVLSLIKSNSMMLLYTPRFEASFSVLLYMQTNYIGIIKIVIEKIRVLTTRQEYPLTM